MALVGTFLNIIKAIYGKPMARITLNEAKIKALPLKSVTRQGCPLSLFLFNMALKDNDIAITQERDIKVIQMERMK